MKCAPRKVYIKESGGYVELSYTDFCRRRQADKGYMDKLFIATFLCHVLCGERFLFLALQ